MPRFQLKTPDRLLRAKIVGFTAAVGLHIAVLAAVMMASRPQPEMPELAGETIHYVDLGDAALASSDSEDDEAEPALPAVSEPDESVDEPETEPEPIPEPEPEIIPEPEPEPEPEPIPEPEPEPEPIPEPEPEPEPIPEPEPEPEPTPEPEPEPEPIPEPEPEPIPEPKPEPKPQPKPEPKPQPKPRPKPAPPPVNTAAALPPSQPAPAATPEQGPPAAEPAAAPADTSQPKVVSSVDYLGRRPNPVYPRASERRREQGRVVVRVLISTSGEVVDASVARSSGHERLDEAALKAVRQARFRPYKENGVAYQALADIPFDFVL